ncbi:SRPBCC domain-containing protein [Wenxinia saemankumensis]|uniref:Uncharacterized conserved protein YndB, AHSA1/START domain n=1 Tax=Wenxinia saemankumensis TaxID=1447782 RepID=A0A1M6E769_9RHOB|nr:SRPBCC domain-containing protein [Wenxinia saemankumensis]SHI81374.1 Uncharacterized conserved protein YndB, AHSA1/START domain [Wenxinia saemankumensis]
MIPAPDPSGTDLAFTRTLAAPRDLVWACWTDPRLLAKWFYPGTTAIAEMEIDARPGGVFRSRLEGEAEPHMNGVVLEAEPARRLVWTDAFRPGWIMAPDPFVTAILTFGDAPEGTRYDVLVRHASPEKRADHEARGFFAGWGSATDKLGETAAAERGPAPDREGRITRRIAAPPALVWKAWTDPDLLPKWWGPDGFSCETESIDLREGGHWAFTMTGFGQRFPNRHDFTAMEPERRLAYRLSGFDDMRHHADVEVTFAPEGEGTRVEMRMTFVDTTMAEAMSYGALEKGYETLASLEAMARTL